MRGAIKDQIKWQRAIILMHTNPDVPRVRIGRVVGYTGQMIGFIAKSIGMPPGKAGGYQKKDEELLTFPPGWFKDPECMSDEERDSMREILQKACPDYEWKRPIWMEGKERVEAK